MAFHFLQNSMFHFTLYLTQSILHFVFVIWVRTRDSTFLHSTFNFDSRNIQVFAFDIQLFISNNQVFVFDLQVQWYVHSFLHPTFSICPLSFLFRHPTLGIVLASFRIRHDIAQKPQDMRTRALASVSCIPAFRFSKWRRTNQHLTRHCGRCQAAVLALRIFQHR